MYLPVELAGAVAHHSNQSVLRTLSLVSHKWYGAATRELYATVNLSARPESNKTTKFLWTIVAQPILGSYVQSLDIYTWEYSSWNGAHTVASLFTPALRAMPNLQHLGAKLIYNALKADDTCEEVLSSLAKLQSFRSGHCADGTFDMNRILRILPPLRHLGWDQLSGPSADLEALIVRSRDKLEGLAVNGFDIGQLFRNWTVRYPRLQVLVVGWGIDLANLNGPAFTSLAYITAWSFESVQLLGQVDFLPRLRFMRTSMSFDDDVFGRPPVTSLPRIVSKRVLQHLSVDSIYIGGQGQGHRFHELDIFNHVEVRSLAIQDQWVNDAEDSGYALRALAQIGATADLRMLVLHMKRQGKTVDRLAVQIVKLAAQGHLSNLQYLHLRAENRNKQRNWDWPHSPADLKTFVDGTNRSRALLAKALPSLEVVEFIVVCAGWSITATVRWTRLVLSSDSQNTVPTPSDRQVAKPIQNTGKRSGRLLKILQGFKRYREVPSLPTSIDARRQTEEEAWDMEVFHGLKLSYSPLPTPWLSHRSDMHQFNSVIDRYTIA